MPTREVKILIGIAGGSAPNGRILTEDACRLAVEKSDTDVDYEFDEMTGNLYANIRVDDDDSNFDNVWIPYPKSWLKIENIDDSRT